jgi:thiol-disulfide isomerase/thioredoxin
MALTPSKELSPGWPLPGFALPDVTSGRTFTPADFTGAKALVVIFLCRHCPYVVHVMPTLLGLAREYLAQGVAFAGISANDAANYPDDSPERLRDMVLTQDIPFPVLHDETQDTARAFHAACTPEFFVFDGAQSLYYHGRLDASTPGNNIPCTGGDLRAALDGVLTGQSAPADQHPSMGCNIKWK